MKKEQKGKSVISYRSETFIYLKASSRSVSLIAWRTQRAVSLRVPLLHPQDDGEPAGGRGEDGECLNPSPCFG